MSTDQPQLGASGVATYFGVLFSPPEAFDTLARVPMWGWACVLGLVITVVATIIGLPATMHIAQAAQQAAIAQAPADQQQAMRDGIAKFAPYLATTIIFTVLIASWIIWLVTSLCVLAAAAIGRGAVNFGAAWVLTVNSFAIPALGTLIANVILRLQGAENLSKQSDAYVLPSLAMLMHGDPKTAALLYSFNVINLWYFAILAVGLQRVMKINAATAWLAAIVFAVLSALLAMNFAK